MSRLLTGSVILISLVALGGAKALARPRVTAAVLPLTVAKGLPGAAYAGERFEAALAAAGLDVLGAAQLRERVPGELACSEGECLRALAGKLSCRYVAGGRISGDRRAADLELFVVDGYSGKTAARVSRRCELCGEFELLDTLTRATQALTGQLAAAARAPGRLQLRATPLGASVTVDGAPLGSTPREVTLTAGVHVVAVSAPGHLTDSREIAVSAGETTRVEVRLVPAPADRTVVRALGWSTLAAGVAMIVAGAVLLALDGKGLDCGEAVGTQVSCRSQRATLPEGAVITGVGVAGAAVAGYLLYRGYRTAPREQAVTVSGASLGLRF